MPAFDLERSQTVVTQHRSPLRAVAVAIAVGAAFGAGALAGKTGSATRPADGLVLEAADRRAAELDEKRAALRLGFASELLVADKKTRPPPLPRSEKTPAVASLQERAATPLAAPPEREPERERAETAPPPAARPDVEPDGDDAFEGPARKAPDPARMKQALAKVLGDDSPADKASEKAADRKSFTLQVASTPLRENADALQKKLSDQGLSARVVEAELDGGKKVFRVRVGSFDARERAESYKGKVPMPAFIVSE